MFSLHPTRLTTSAFNSLSSIYSRTPLAGLFSRGGASGNSISLPDGTTLPAEHAQLAGYLIACDDLPTPSLNALDTRSPSHLSAVAYLIDTGRTPATSDDALEVYTHIHKALPTDAQLRATIMQLRDFGLYRG